MFSLDAHIEANTVGCCHKMGFRDVHDFGTFMQPINFPLFQGPPIQLNPQRPETARVFPNLLLIGYSPLICQRICNASLSTSLRWLTKRSSVACLDYCVTTVGLKVNVDGDTLVSSTADSRKIHSNSANDTLREPARRKRLQAGSFLSKRGGQNGQNPIGTH